MGLQQTLTYDDGASFTYDSNLIAFSSGKAKLKLVSDAGKLFSQAFASSAGFTFDAAKVEFVGGVMRQKDQRPAGAIFYASFTSSVDGNWGAGTLAGTAVGSPPTPAGTLDLRGSTLKYVSWNIDNVATLLQTGCIRFGLIPNYSGTPATNQAIVGKGQSSTDKNQLDILHLNDGNLLCRVYSNTSGVIIFTLSAAWSPVAGTTYEIELNYDATTGAARVFINGTQLGSTVSGTGSILLGTSNQFRVGTQIGASSLTANFQLTYLAVFNTVQHTANYSAPSAVLSETAFLDAVATLPDFAYSGPGAVQSFDAAVATLSAGAARFVVNDLYWNGSAWAASDGSYAQASTAAQIVANIATLPRTLPVSVDVVFQAGATQAGVDLFSIQYTGQLYPTTDPPIVPQSATNMNELLSFAAVLAASGSDGVKFQLQLGSTLYWWNGTAWATSSGAYAQANTYAEIETNKATLTTEEAGVAFKVRAVLHSADGSTTPELESATFGYNAYFPLPTALVKCIVYGFVDDFLGGAQNDGDVKLVVEQSEAEVWKHGSFLVRPKTVEVFPDDEGRFEVALVESETIEKLYKFSLVVDGETLEMGTVAVPNAVSANLATLLEAAA